MAENQGLLMEAPILTSHRESIAAADARKALPLHLLQPPAPALNTKTGYTTTT